MKKVILYCILAIGMIANAQTNNVITKKLQLENVPLGNKNDSVLVWSANKIVKHRKLSDMLQGSGGSQNLQQVIGLGTANEVVENDSIPNDTLNKSIIFKKIQTTDAELNTKTTHTNQFNSDGINLLYMGSPDAQAAQINVQGVTVASVGDINNPYLRNANSTLSDQGMTSAITDSEGYGSASFGVGYTRWSRDNIDGTSYSFSADLNYILPYVSLRKSLGSGQNSYELSYGFSELNNEPYLSLSGSSHSFRIKTQSPNGTLYQAVMNAPKIFDEFTTVVSVNGQKADEFGNIEISSNATIPTFQEIVNNDTYDSIALDEGLSTMSFLGGYENNRNFYADIANGSGKRGSLSTGAGFTLLYAQDENTNTEGRISIDDGKILLSQVNTINGFKQTNVVIDSPTVSTTFHIPSKTIAGDYTIATTEDTPKVKIGGPIQGQTFATVGEIWFWNNFIYICVGGANWVRAELTTY